MKSVVHAGLALCLLMSSLFRCRPTTARRMNNQDLAAEAEVIVSGPRPASRPIWNGRALFW